MSTKDQAWADRVGREAVDLGFAPTPGLMATCDGDSFRLSIHFGPWADFVPDFRDRLTELACIAWVEDVAREVYGIGCRVVVKLSGDGICGVEVFRPDGACVIWCAERETLAEECIAAVRAMKGGE